MIPNKILLYVVFLVWITSIVGYALCSDSMFSSDIHRKTTPILPVPVPNECRIIALGDSITAGYELDPNYAYPARLEALLGENGYPCTVVNAWVSGDTSRGLLDRLNFTLDGNYTLAILTIGGNDGLRGLPISELGSNMEKVIETLRSKNIPVVLGGMQIPNNAGSYAREFRDLYSSVARRSGTPILPFFLEGVALKPEYNLPDGIHPNARGYEIIARNVFDFLHDWAYLKDVKK